MKKVLVLLLAGLIPAAAWADDPIRLDSGFDAAQVRWALEPGDAEVSGTAAIRLEDGTTRNCAGFNVELLPVAEYSNERIRRTYGNNESGQILLSQKPPRFTPDAPGYHEMLLKSSCDASGNFRFSNVPAGDYYVMVFIIWEAPPSGATSKAGGAVMRRIRVAPGSTHTVTIEP